METAFLFDLGLNWETRAPLLLRYNDTPQLGPPRLAHLIARDYVRYRYVTEEMFNAYFRFAVVRNPWSRTVSLYRHLDFNMPFREFVTSWLADEIGRGETADRYWFIRPQTEFVSDKGRRLVNEIVRFENLQEDFKRIAVATGLKTPLPHVNKSKNGADSAKPGGTPLRQVFKTVGAALAPNRRENHEQWKEFYRDDTAEIVGRLYESDVTEFNYSFDG